jgi:MFS family permease
MSHDSKLPAGLDRHALAFIAAAAGILMITMGMRQSMGLFIAPIIDSTHVGYAAMSFAMAVGQLMWGVAQPTFGALADRFGAWRALLAGAFMMAAGAALTPFAGNEFTLILTIGVLTAAGAGAGSFGVLIGQVAQRVPADRRSVASGMVNAGGSLGQSVFAPLYDFLIKSISWMGAMWVMAAAALATIPLARSLARSTAGKSDAAARAGHGAPGAVTTLSMREQLAVAARDKSYWCLHAGFFTCGFHIAFLVTHLPGEVKLCALPTTVASTALSIIGFANVAGSLWAGWAGGVMRMKYLLFGNYLSRALIIAIYLAAPKTAVTFYLFAAALGFTWLATVPPTAGLIGKLFGVRYLATLFGLTTFTHQVGAFFGAWLGGIALVKFGDYSWMWYADMALATLAAFVNLPIREAKLRPVLAPA